MSNTKKNTKKLAIHLASRSSSNESIGKGVFATITYEGDDRVLAYIPSDKALSDFLALAAPNMRIDHL
jgi:hypothetical protein